MLLQTKKKIVPWTSLDWVAWVILYIFFGALWPVYIISRFIIHRQRVKESKKDSVPSGTQENFEYEHKRGRAVSEDTKLEPDLILELELKESKPSLYRINTLINKMTEASTCIKLEFKFEKYSELVKDSYNKKLHLDQCDVGKALFGTDFILRINEYLDGVSPPLMEIPISTQEVESSSSFIGIPIPSYRTGDIEDNETSGELWLSVFTREFRKSIQKLDKKVKGRIVEAIMDICESPMELRGDTQKPLVGELEGHWRYRIGDYRLIYLPMTDYHRIVFTRFDSRGQIYH